MPLPVLLAGLGAKLLAGAKVAATGAKAVATSKTAASIGKSLLSSSLLGNALFGNRGDAGGAMDYGVSPGVSSLGGFGYMPPISVGNPYAENPYDNEFMRSRRGMF